MRLLAVLHTFVPVFSIFCKQPYDINKMSHNDFTIVDRGRPSRNEYTTFFSSANESRIAESCVPYRVAVQNAVLTSTTSPVNPNMICCTRGNSQTLQKRSQKRERQDQKTKTRGETKHSHIQDKTTGDESGHRHSERTSIIPIKPDQSLFYFVRDGCAHKGWRDVSSSWSPCRWFLHRRWHGWTGEHE